MNEYPIIVRVSGREYEVSPDMPLGDFIEVVESLKAEADKVKDVARSNGIQFEEEM